MGRNSVGIRIKNEKSFGLHISVILLLLQVGHACCMNSIITIHYCAGEWKRRAPPPLLLLCRTGGTKTPVRMISFIKYAYGLWLIFSICLKSDSWPHFGGVLSRRRSVVVLLYSKELTPVPCIAFRSKRRSIAAVIRTSFFFSPSPSFESPSSLRWCNYNSLCLP